MTFLSKRVQKVPPSGIRRFFDLVLGSKGVISLGVGEPDFLTPWNIRDEAIYRLEKGHTTYTSNLGLIELRNEISKYLANQFSLSYSSEELLVTNGVSEAVDIVMRAFVDDGDEVILPEPTYVCYRPLIELCGGVVVPLDTSLSEFVPRADQIESLITEKTKAIILSYPNNPTGQSIPFSELEKIGKIAMDHNILIITDEIYGDISFDPFRSIAEISDIKNNIIYLNGFSKTHSMTGWRLGYIGASVDHIEAINKIHQYSALCAPTLSQYAAIEACKSVNEVPKMKQSYMERSRFFANYLNKLGLETLLPKGGLYCFSKISHLEDSSLQFAEKLLNQEKVAVVPGSVFGVGGEGYIRSCIAINFVDLKLAAERIGSFVKSYAK